MDKFKGQWITVRNDTLWNRSYALV